MKYQLFFTEYPQVMDWGDLRIVPLNIKEDVIYDEQNNVINGYRADLVFKVKQPVTVDTIIDAAINSEFTKDEQCYIMRNMNDSENLQVIKFNNFVKDITEYAKVAGY